MKANFRNSYNNNDDKWYAGHYAGHAGATLDQRRITKKKSGCKGGVGKGKDGKDKGNCGNKDGGTGNGGGNTCG